MKPLTILSGPPGAGKTTVARALVALTSEPIVVVEGDKFWSFVARRDEAINDSTHFRMTMRAMMSASVHYAANGYDTFLDFSIPPWFLETAKAVAKFREVPLNYVVLLPSEEVCAARAAGRSEGRVVDYTVYHDFYSSFVNAGKNAVAGDLMDPATTANQIRKGIDAGLFRVSE